MGIVSDFHLDEHIKFRDLWASCATINNLLSLLMGALKNSNGTRIRRVMQTSFTYVFELVNS